MHVLKIPDKMSKTEIIQVNIEPKLKHEVEEILQNLGLTVSEAMTCSTGKSDRIKEFRLRLKSQMQRPKKP